MVMVAEDSLVPTRSSLRGGAQILVETAVVG